MTTVDSKVLQIIHELIGVEGGYTNNPNDSGGPTIWGITEQVARAFGYTGDMQAMPQDTAVNIYVQRYWVQPRFDQVFNVSPTIAIELFDSGVNLGTSTSSKWLQRALNVLNKGATSYPDMTVDGSIGAMTISSLSTFLQARGKDGETVLLRMLNSQQGMRYIEIAEANPKNETFEFGWFLNRVQ